MEVSTATGMNVEDLFFKVGEFSCSLSEIATNYKL